MKLRAVPAENGDPVADILGLTGLSEALHRMGGGERQREHHGGPHAGRTRYADALDAATEDQVREAIQAAWKTKHPEEVKP